VSLAGNDGVVTADKVPADLLARFDDSPFAGGSQ